MPLKPSLPVLALVGLSLGLDAQEKPAAAPIQIRAVLHDPANPVANLFYADKTGAIVPLEFRPQNLSQPVLMPPANGSLVLYDKATIDPGNPEASLAASTKLPPDLKQAIAVVLPAYRMLLIDDSANGFPGGESRALSLTNVECAIQAGEHKLPVKPGAITRVPTVRKVNEFNMAQTNFYYQQNGSWVAFAERQLQFQDASRRIFIIHATPGASQPTVATIVDTSL
jgi:hypothetical protein